MGPDLDAFSRPVRHLVLAAVVVGPLLFAALVIVGTVSSPTIAVEATVVGEPPATEDHVYRLSGVDERIPTRASVEGVLRNGSGSVGATVEEVRSDPEFSVRHDEQVVRVTISWT